MRQARPRLAWWLLVVATASSIVASVPFWGQIQNPSFVIPALGYAAVGALVARRRPDNPLGWVFVLVGLLAGMLGTANTIGYVAVERGAPYPWWAYAAAMSSGTWPLLLTAMTTWTILLYPDGLPSRRWRLVFWLSAVDAMAMALLYAFQPQFPLNGSTDGSQALAVDNPLSPLFLARLGDAEQSAVFGLLVTVMFGCLVLAVVCAVLRFHGSRGVERLQMRWFVFAVLMAAVLMIGPPSISGDGALGDLVFSAVLTLVPVSCGVAILRYRLYDIDRIISRTTAYLLVSGLLVATYAGVVTLVSRLVPASSNLAVAAATLSMAAAARPLLARTRRVVDRRFNRERYDAVRTVDEFGGRLRDQVDAAGVSGDLLAVVARTVQPSAAVLWIPERQS